MALLGNATPITHWAFSSHNSPAHRTPALRASALRALKGIKQCLADQEGAPK